MHCRRISRKQFRSARRGSVWIAKWSSRRSGNPATRGANETLKGKKTKTGFTAPRLVRQWSGDLWEIKSRRSSSSRSKKPRQRKMGIGEFEATAFSRPFNVSRVPPRRYGYPDGQSQGRQRKRDRWVGSRTSNSGVDLRRPDAEMDTRIGH